MPLLIHTTPYPDYNNKARKASNRGSYTPRAGPDEEVRELAVFSGHPRAFRESAIGSYLLLDIDGKLCFERESRLGPYGYQEEETRMQGVDPEAYRNVWTGMLSFGEITAILLWEECRSICTD